MLNQIEGTPMHFEIVRQPRILDEVNGEVVAIGRDGAVRKLTQGEKLQSNEIMMTSRNASVVLSTDGVPSKVSENSIFIDLENEETKISSVTPVNGDIEFNLEQLSGSLDGNDIAAIQDAILQGADPTQILEATAAGEGIAGSANTGFVTIEYNRAEALPTTFFETSNQSQKDDEEFIDGLRTFVFASGGEKVSKVLGEGGLSAGTYPQVKTATATIFAGDLSLDAESFVPEPASMISLLSELNSKITSSGESVTFTYDEADIAFIGVNSQGEVLRIDIDSELVGKNINIELTTTVRQPIDHVTSIGEGQVAIIGDQVSVSFKITGADSGGNAIQSPIDAQIFIDDGVNPTPQNTFIRAVESDSSLIQGQLVEIGSDYLLSVTFDNTSLQQFDGLLSDNQNTTASISEDGTTITLRANSTGETVLTVSVDTQGQYYYQQYKPLEQNGSNTISLSLTTTIVDYDQDRVSNVINIEIVDGKNPIITGISELTLDEAGLVNGSQPRIDLVSGSGVISASAGSDIIDHFELEPNEFNTDGSLTAHGQTVLLELANSNNGIRTYEGFIELNGNRVTVFEIKLDWPVQGDYQFTLSEQLDHLGSNNASLTIELPVYAVDAGGDRSELLGGTGSEEAGKILIEVKDDILSFNGAESLSVSESTLASGSAPNVSSLEVTGQFSIVEGADRVVNYRLDTSTDPIANLTSNGLVISLTETYDSATNSYIYTGSTNTQEIFRLSLRPDGSYTFALKAPIDHDTNSNNAPINFIVVATDGDGDTDRITLPVSIGDDQPKIVSVDSLSIQENDLVAGSSPDGSKLSKEGDLTIKSADNIVSYRLDLSTDPINGVTSQGKAIILSESVDVNGVVTYTASTSDNEVFILTLFQDGRYIFELKTAIDHDANSNSKQMDFTVEATDIDGDKDSIILPITIGDDSPSILSIHSSSTFIVDEENTVAGSGTPAIATGSFVTAGADDVVSYKLVNLSDTQNALKSNGEVVTISEVTGVSGATTYQGTAGGDVIFTLVLSDNGGYAYTQIKALDHDENTDSLTVPFDVVAIDRESDVSDPIRLPIKVIDDQPTLSGVTGETTVDEDDIAVIGSDRSDNTSIRGDLNVTEGADGIIGYEITNTDSVLDGLSVGGENIEWSTTQTSGTTFIYTAVTQSSNEPVLRIIFDTSNHSYQFDLYKSFDHADGSGENNIQLALKVKALDFDGDKSDEVTLPITIIDDVPLLSERSISRVEGSEFATVNMFDSESDKGADDAQITLIEGSTDGNSVIKFGGVNGSYVDSVDIQSGIQTIKVYQEYEATSGITKIRELGELRVNSNGTIDFKAFDNLEHSDDVFNFTIDVTATDGDNDKSKAQLDLSIVDRQASAIALEVKTFEDSGRVQSINYNPSNVELANAQDNLSSLSGLDAPLKISLQTNLHDADNDESIGGMTIKPGEHHGSFYYFDGHHYVEIAPNNTGEIHIDAAVIDQSSSVNSAGDQIATINNLYFVPDRNYSSNQSGIKIDYQLEIHNGGVFDHSLDASFRIEVESIADTAVWDDANSTYEYMLAEDGDSQTLRLNAVTQDNSNPEIMTYRLEVTQGQGEFELLNASGQVIAEESSGVYLISSDQINSVQLKPREHFSGAIKFETTVITTETTNAVSGKETAESDTKVLVFNVTPKADESSFSVNRISIFEDNAASQDTVDPEVDHESFTLDKVITLNSTDDINTTGDTSEVLYVRLSDFTDENGQPLVGFEVRWVSSGSPLPLIIDGSNTYYEIEQSDLDKVEIQPPLHSNDDFNFEVTGIVKDTATLGDGSQVTDVVEMSAGKLVHVSVKGVADIPHIPDIEDIPVTGADLDTWYNYTDKNGNAGAQVVINENSSIELSYAVLSGEEKDGVNDNSESITVLLSDIPEGVKLYDNNGGVVDLVYVGNNANGPIYQANITQQQYQSGITVEPPEYWTQDINISTKAVITENDGHIREVDGSILIKVVPVIDAGGHDAQYSRTSFGDEDSFIVVPWDLQNEENPDRVSDVNGRDYEYVTSITISGFPENVEITIDGLAVSNYTGGTANYDQVTNTLTITGLNESSSQPIIRVKPPEDSSLDMDLQSTLIIEEYDADNNGDHVDPKEVTGSLTVVVRPVVEIDGVLQVTSNNTVVTTIDDANYDGRIDFTINDQNGGANVINFKALDPGSEELVKDVVVRFVGISGDDLNQLFVQGAINNGDGSWTIVNEENFSIIAPNGLNYAGGNSLKVEFVAQVYDKGDEGETGSVSQKSTTVDLTFPDSISGPNSKASVIEQIISADAILLGIEDNYLDLSDQLSNVIKISGDSNSSTADNVVDELSIVIDPSKIPGEVTGLKVIGAHHDFANNLYLFKATVTQDGNIDIPDGLKIVLPEDYAGDFKLPITFVTTDIESGDENRIDLNIPIAISPVVDITPDTGEQSQPLDADILPEVNLTATSVAKVTGNVLDVKPLEDNLIKLDFDITLADSSNSTHQGQETVTKLKITVSDASIGYFADVNGAPIQPDSSVFIVDSNDPSVIQAALDSLYFVPQDNYPTDISGNSVSFTVEATVVDQTIFDTTGTTQVTSIGAERTFTQNVDIDIVPVTDSVNMPTANDNIIVVADEDTDIALNFGGSGLSIELNDTDGSEQFLSAKLTGVPEDFTVISQSSEFVVKSSGGGEWVIQLTDSSITTIDLSAISIRPAEHFSGTADIGITVFTQEQLLQEPKEHHGQFAFEVRPVGDVVDIDPVYNAAGAEGENIDIAIDANIVDKSNLSTGNINQDRPETLLITVEQVPDGATIYYPDGVTAATNLGNGKWELRVDAQELEKIVFNSGDNNRETWNESSLKVTVQSIDKDANGNEYLGPTTNQVFDVVVDVEAINDKPDIDITNITSVISESANQTLSGIVVGDVDAINDEAMTVTVSVDFGRLDVNLIPAHSVSFIRVSESSISLTGPISELNALLDSPASGMGIQIDASYAPSDSVTLTIAVTDVGNPSGMLETEQKLINITPVANSVTLSIAADDNDIKNIYSSVTASNNGIALSGIVAALTDVHEELSLELSDIPAGASVKTSSGTLVPVGGKLVVPASEIDSISIVGAQEGAHTIQLTAISMETDGSTAESVPIDINLTVTADGSNIDNSLLGQDSRLLGSDEGIELYAGAGDDRIVGGAGVDTLDGGLGSDMLTGGEGEDIFIWNEIDGGVTDTITDFNVAEGDKIDLREVLTELKQENVDMNTLLAQLDANLIDGDDIKLNVHPDGSAGQTILVEDLGLQIDFSNMDSSQIISTLIDNNIILNGQ